MSSTQQSPAPLLRLRPAAAALVLALGLAACSGENAAPQGGAPQALPVTVLEMQPQNLPASLELMAQTEGAKETEVRARVGGILMKRLYQEGALVKAGQPLFQIDRAPYEIALAEAKAKAEQTAREEGRLKGLLARQAVSQKEYDDAASNNAIAQAALRQAQLNLSWTTVTAPVSGTSGRAVKSEGNLINTSDASLLTSVYQANPMWVRFGLSESDTANLPGGQLKAEMVSGVELILPDGSVYDKPGKINFLASTIDTTLGTQQRRQAAARPVRACAPAHRQPGRRLPGAPGCRHADRTGPPGDGGGRRKQGRPAPGADRRMARQGLGHHRRPQGRRQGDRGQPDEGPPRCARGAPRSPGCTRRPWRRSGHPGPGPACRRQAGRCRPRRRACQGRRG